MRSQRLSRRNFLKSAGAVGAVAVFAACAPPPQGAPAAESGAAAPSGEQIPLLMWYQAQNHEPEYTRRQEEFEEKFNIDLTYEILGREAMTKKLPTTLMAGSGFPDIIEQNAQDIVGFMKGSDAEIPMLALNEFVDAGPYATDVLDSRWARYTKDGKRYGAPHDVHPIVMLYNNELWQENGVDMEQIETWNDFLSICESTGTEMVAEDGNTRFQIIDTLVGSTLPTMMLQNGVWWTDEAGEPMLTDPAFKEACENWMRFEPYHIEIDWGANAAMMKSGAAMTQMVPDWYYGIHKIGANEDADYMANSPMRVKQVPDGPDTGSWGGTAASVLKASSIADLGVNVLLYIYFENGENQLDTRWLETGILPPVPTAWESDAYQQADDYVGGQVSGQVFIDAANSLPPYFENWKTNLVTTAWGEQFGLAWEGEISLDEAITNADENARAEIEKNS